eukprot:15363465-Ditylum_brightwellii.AAC.1
MKQVLHYKVAQWCKLPGLTPLIVLQDAIGLALGKAIEEQADLGWHNFIKGCILKHWAEAQYTYSQSVPTKKDFNRDQWNKQLIKNIWMIFVDI